LVHQLFGRSMGSAVFLAQQTGYGLGTLTS